MIQKIQRQVPLATVAYQEIKKALLNGTIPLDTTLTERYLTERLGVSRTPVRSAIQRLIQEGLLTQDKSGILTTLNLNKNHLIQIAQARITLEIGAYYTLDHEDYTPLALRLSKHQKAMEIACKKQDFLTFNHHDDLFHHAVFLILDNPILMNHWSALAAKLSMIRHYTQKTQESAQKSMTEHDAIIHALQNKSLDALFNKLKKHAFNQYVFLYEHL